ncbi:ubiquitin carboxyl-terminal hydrolase family protein [Actinidia rufa]|uniref:Ubiquitin carboxyl-terminal hydrolase family protein n=1 Tax=Actinidia rufa TaxID=165716 RepID=A0A7J0ERF6_9ERIC|nr:ubiquitin carboxyl-terminal hydrolase family protein [Actinidia rufa]
MPKSSGSETRTSTPPSKKGTPQAHALPLNPNRLPPLQNPPPLHRLRLSTDAVKFVKKYPSVFAQFRLRHRLSLPRIKLTSQALIAHKEEAQVLDSPIHRKNAAERLSRLLMLAGVRRLPLKIVNGLEFNLGLPHHYILTLVSEFPEYFQICSTHCDDSNSCEMLGLKLISWRDDFAISVMERGVMNVGFGGKGRMRISFPMELPRGFDLEKKVRNWVDEWQKLLYISPYENAFHLLLNGDQEEKWWWRFFTNCFILRCRRRRR